VRLFVTPVIVGGGLPALPDGLRIQLTLQDVRRFARGVALLGFCVDG
jgi:hypothetical protein